MASAGATSSEPATPATVAATAGGTTPALLSASYVAMNTPVPGTEPSVSTKKPL